MRHVFRIVSTIAVAALLIAIQLPGVLAQTDEELRQLYFKRDFDRIEEFARAGNTRAEGVMGLIMNNQQRRDEAKEWYRRAAEKDDRFATGEEARQGGRVLPFSRPNETG
jgi:hypothetical protein